MSSELERVIKSYIGRGAFFIRRKGATENFAPHRDLSNALPLLIGEAIGQTEVCHPDWQPEDSHALDMVAMYMRLLVQCGGVDNKEALCKLNELYVFLQEDPRRRSIYGTFCAHFFEASIAFLYTAGEMAVGNLKELPKSELANYTAATSLLSRLSPELRRQVLAEIQDTPADLPEHAVRALKSRTDSFLEIAQYDQQLRIDEARRRAEAAEQKEV